MLLDFFLSLRRAGVPVSLREHLTLLALLDADRGLADGPVMGMSVEAFYVASRAALVKDERWYDRFDQVFAQVFRGLEAVAGGAPEDEDAAPRAIPEEWLRKLAERHLTEEEKALVDGLGGWDKLMETLKERLREQQGRHQGGSKWIGTAGTSPFGAYGYNPEGVRIGQSESRHRRAVKVWDKRAFRDLDGDAELGVRAIKLALRRLRRWARDGAAEELDLPGTIRATSDKGYLDVKMRPERRNRVKVLLFMDVGGSMDDHVLIAEQLFSAARLEFKTLEFFYFHNCLYEGVWRENRRRWDAQTPTAEVLRTFGPDYKVVVVGDASMSPYEIAVPGGAVEHWNPESGETWLRRLRAQWPNAVWLNPVEERLWRYTPSVQMIRTLFEDAMFPMTLQGLDGAMRALGR